jgi:hypothetical protein
MVVIRLLTDQRRADLIARGWHGRLPVTKAIQTEYIDLLCAAQLFTPPEQRKDRRYEIALRSRKLDALLAQYDRHLRRTRARVLVT